MGPAKDRRVRVPRALALGGLLAAWWFAPVLGAPTSVRTYTESDGIPGTWIADLAQAPDGRMFFLAAGGAVAYDGTEWQRIDQATGEPLRRGFGLSFEPDGSGWALTEEGVLFRLRDGTWTRRAEPPFDVSETLPTDFEVFHPGGVPVPVVATLNRGLFRLRDEGWERLEDIGGRPGARAHALLADGERLWVATDDGLWAFVNGAWTLGFRPPAGFSPAVRGVAFAGARPGPDEALYVVGADWVGRLDSGEFVPLARDVADSGWLRYPRVRLAADGAGGLYFGNAGGLWHLDPLTGNVGELAHDHGLVGGGVLAFHRDRENNLWIATGVGVSKVADSPFRSLGSADGLLEDQVTAIAETAGGTLVFGHAAGLTLFRGGVERTIPLESESVVRVLDLEPDGQGRVWVAGAGMGLVRVSTGGDVERVVPGGPDPDRWISSARFDDAGRLWLGGPAGAFLLEEGRAVPVPTHVAGLRDVRRILRGAGGTLYFATGRDGLLVRRDGRWTHVRHRSHRPADDVFSVLELGERTLVGSRGGLFLLQDGEIADPDPAELPTIDRPVYSMSRDAGGTVWLGTDFGVYRWQPGVLPPHAAPLRGVAGLETSRAANLIDSSGRLWIGTDRGLSVLSVDNVREEIPAPRVELLAVEARGATLDATGDARLRHDRNDLVFRVRAISFVDETRVQFRTRLEGLEPSWQLHDPAGTRLVAGYPRIPRGVYRLEAQARAAAGRWGPVLQSTSFEIMAPFWRRPWFVAAVTGAAALILYFVHAWFLQHRYSRRLEREVAAQTVELDKAGRAVESERARLAAVLGSIADGVIALDGRDRLVLTNPAAERMLAGGRPIPAGSSPARLFEQRGEEARATFVAWVEELRRLPPDRWKQRPLTLIDTTGSAPSLELAADRYRHEGMRAGLVIAFRDISERLRIESELEKSRRIEALGVLAGGIAHDFNNLLTAMLGNISLVRDTASLDPESDSRLRATEDAIGRAHRLAGRLVTFAQGGAPVTAPESVVDMIDETARFTLSGSGVSFSPCFDPESWPVEVESDQIRQVFENLFINARQAMDDSGRILLRARNVDAADGALPEQLRPGKYVRIDLHDEGPGIPPDQLGRIFEPYFTTKEDGSGLGLATSYSIVVRHGGFMSVTSAPGTGTTFSIFLPAAKDSPVRAVPALEALPAGRKVRVLVLDDEPAVASVLDSLLSSLGHEVTTTRHGDETIAALRDALQRGERFHVAILDLTIPGGRGGGEIVSELSALDPELFSIASSGYSDAQVMSDHAAFGFGAVLPKPYRLEHVEAAIAPVVLRAPSG